MKYFKITYNDGDIFYKVKDEDVAFFKQLYAARGCEVIEVSSIPLIIDFDKTIC